MRNIFSNKHFVVLVGNGVTSVIGMGMTFIAYHNFATLEIAGIWFLLQSYVGLCEQARGGLLATATIKFYAGASRERAETVLGSVWMLALLFSGALMLVNGMALFCLPYVTNYELVLGIKWIGLNFLSSLPSDIVFWRLQADEQYTKMLWLRMINACSTLAAFVALILLHRFTLENVIFCNLLTNCFTSLIGMLWFGSGIQFIGRRTKACMREIFHYGKYTFGTTLFSSLLGNADIWILNLILGPAAVAIYNLAMRLMAFIDLPLRSFATTGMSEMAISFNKLNMHQVGYVFKKYSGMLTIAFIPAAILAFILGPLVMPLLGGHHFDGAAGALASNAYSLVMVLAISYPIDRFNGLALDITHHTKTNFYKMIIVISVKIVCGLLATQLLKSLYGIIIANYVAMVVSILFGYYHLRKHIPHTIGGVIGIGYEELVVLLRNLRGAVIKRFK